MPSDNKICLVADPVSPATGNEYFPERLVVANDSLGMLTFNRYYNSLVTNAGALGEKWQHQYSSKLRFGWNYFSILPFAKINSTQMSVISSTYYNRKQRVYFWI